MRKTLHFGLFFAHIQRLSAPIGVEVTIWIAKMKPTLHNLGLIIKSILGQILGGMFQE
jgi:hypothetical protein